LSKFEREFSPLAAEPETADLAIATAVQEGVGEEPPVEQPVAEVPAVEQSVTDEEELPTEEPTTDTSGAVSAHGEVRDLLIAPDEDPAEAPLSTDNDTTPVEDEVENPTGIGETPSPTDDKPVSTPSEGDGESGVE
jgi:hypothetical protein